MRVLYFITGAAIGGGAAFVLTRLHYKKKYELELDAVKKTYAYLSERKEKKEASGVLSEKEETAKVEIGSDTDAPAKINPFSIDIPNEFDEMEDDYDQKMGEMLYGTGSTDNYISDAPNGMEVRARKNLPNGELMLIKLAKKEALKRNEFRDFNGEFHSLDELQGFSPDLITKENFEENNGYSKIDTTWWVIDDVVTWSGGDVCDQDERERVLGEEQGFLCEACILGDDDYIYVRNDYEKADIRIEVKQLSYGMFAFGDDSDPDMYKYGPQNFVDEDEDEVE